MKTKEEECSGCNEEFEAKEVYLGEFESLCPTCEDNYDGPSDEDLSHYYEHGNY